MDGRDKPGHDRILLLVAGNVRQRYIFSMTQDTLRLAIAQLNPVVGDVAGNKEKARRARAEAAKQNADLVVFTELFIAGYPPEDLVLKPAFQAACRSAVEELARETKDGGPAMLVGTPWLEGGKLYNATALLDGGQDRGPPLQGRSSELRRVRRKARVRAGAVAGAGELPRHSHRRSGLRGHLERGGGRMHRRDRGEILIVTNASPYRRGVMNERLNVAVPRVIESGLPLIYANQVGGQDELVFEGASFGLNADKSLAFQMRGFREEIALTEWKRESGAWKCVSGPREKLLETDEADYSACMLGLRDYVNKNGFPGVVLGMSGGIDSALCAALAADALGPSRVHCVMLPYKYTAKDSLTDAEQCAKALGVRFETIPIAAAVEGLEAALANTFKGQKRDITEENIQSRARGMILMSISNKFGPMVVTTGNKSEMSVGYATLYGDMNGGFNPIKDLYKTEVYRLSALRNRWKPEDALGPSGAVIPENILTKAPTAELRENQKDQDSLPPYDILDGILSRLVEREESVAGNHRGRIRSRHREAGGAAFESRGIQAPPGRAGREGDAEEFRPRPPLSDRQQIPRHRRAAGKARQLARRRRAADEIGSGGFLAGYHGGRSTPRTPRSMPRPIFCVVRPTARAVLPTTRVVPLSIRLALRVSVRETPFRLRSSRVASRAVARVKPRRLTARAGSPARTRRQPRAGVAVADLGLALDGRIDHLVVFIRDIDHRAADADGRDLGFDVIGRCDPKCRSRTASRPRTTRMVAFFALSPVEDHLVEDDFRIRPDGEHGAVDELDLRRAFVGSLDAVVLPHGVVDRERRDLRAAGVIRGGHDGGRLADRGSCRRARAGPRVQRGRAPAR